MKRWFFLWLILLVFLSIGVVSITSLVGCCYAASYPIECRHQVCSVGELFRERGQFMAVGLGLSETRRDNFVLRRNFHAVGMILEDSQWRYVTIINGYAWTNRKILDGFKLIEILPYNYYLYRLRTGTLETIFMNR